MRIAFITLLIFFILNLGVDYYCKAQVNNLLADYATKEEIPSLEGYAKFWNGTQSEYDALETKDNNTIYIITE